MSNTERTSENMGSTGLGIRSQLLRLAENDRIKGVASLGPSLTFLSVVYFLPILALFILSFATRNDFVNLQFTLEHYISVLSPEELLALQIGELLYVGLLIKSLKISLIVTIASLIISYPITYYIGQRVGQEYRLPLMMLVMLPFWTSYLVRTYSWVPILSENGIINGFLSLLGLPSAQLLYTPFATNLGLVYLHLPFMILPLYASMAGLKSTHIEAAQDLGATRFQVFKEIVFPLTLPGAIAGIIFVFIKTTAAYVVPTLLGGPNGILYMNVVVSQFRQTYNWNFGAALSFVLLAVVLAILYLAQKTGTSMADIQMR